MGCFAKRPAGGDKFVTIYIFLRLIYADFSYILPIFNKIRLI